MKKFLSITLLIFSIQVSSQTATEWNRMGLNEKDKDKKIEYFTKAINLSPDYYIYRYNRGVEFYKKADYQKALEDFNQVIARQSEDEATYYYRGKTYFDMKNYQMALIDFKKATTLKSSDNFNWYMLGRTNYQLEKYELSIQNLTKSIELKSDYASAWNWRAAAYDKLKDYDKAIANYSKAIEIEPNEKYYYTNRGGTYVSMQENQKALDDYTKAISLDSNFDDAYNSRGLRKLDMGDLEGARNDFEKAISINSSNWAYYNNYGITCFESGDYEKAFNMFFKSKNLIPKDNKKVSWPYNKLAESSIYLKKYDDAILYASQAIQLDPKNYTPYRNRAQAYVLTGRIAEALVDIDKSLELNPVYNKSFYTKGLIFEQKKQYDLARQNFKRALELSSSYQTVYREASNALKRIETIEGANEAPLIVITSPIEKKTRGFIVVEQNDANTSEKIISVQGKVSSTNGIFEITVNNIVPEVDLEGYFDAKVPLAYGENKVVIRAKDMKQQLSELSFKITRGNEVKKTIVKEEIAVSGKYYALIIGVDEYEHPQVTDLNNPIKDAMDLKNCLEKNYLFEDANVKLLKNPDRALVYQELDVLSRKIGATDNLLIFYAGHGHWDEQFKKGYWLLKDAAPEDRSSWFSNSDLKDYINAINSRHTLLIADACFSGGIFKTRDAFSNASQEIKMLYESRSRKAMTSGALKTVPDESAFIKYLVKRLEDNSEKYLSSEELFVSFKRAVMLNSDNIPQFGEIHGTGGEGGDFIFVKR